MRLLLCFGLVFLLISCGETVTKKEYQAPDKKWGELFVEVQKQKIFEDSKVFADATPKFKADSILLKFEKQMSTEGFDLKKFVIENFNLPNYAFDEKKSTLDFEKYLETTLLSLKREPNDDNGSLIPTRKNYFVGGGKFEESNYFRSYVIIRALQSIKEDTLAVNQAINNAQFIQDFGHVPAGNRTYYMSRSNPPVFALMIKKLAEKDPKQLEIFGTQLMREYQYWMSSESKEEVSKQKEAQGRGEKSFQKVAFLPNNNLLNRYYDKENVPMAEISISGKTTKGFYENLRATHESEWTEGKRWLSNSGLTQTADILPVELNALLYFMETTLSEVYKAKGKDDYAKSFALLAEKRKAIFNEYFWNESKGFYFDYDFMTQKQRESSTLAGVFPLLVGLSDQKQADKVAQKLEKDFLKTAGLVNELNGSEIGTAEFQFFAIEALKKYGKADLAQKIKDKWLKTNREYFAKFGKIESNYNLLEPLSPQKNSHQQRIDGSLSVLLILLKE
ncbi:trehalase family glycosidase [Lacihabitans soyangensis]|uniref:Trehalase n=1 Tax=Lacihabitans soyangensis TaxID=869394 RepID=A0AAE3H7U0_9BACT|nr:trehalase family glycosidase [Lacihabitans soyangensis]MCP9765746.1 trehalase [Lacihabitans soyangensis]